jgi:hypothetical protein
MKKLKKSANTKCNNKTSIKQLILIMPGFRKVLVLYYYGTNSTVLFSIMSCN